MRKQWMMIMVLVVAFFFNTLASQAATSPNSPQVQVEQGNQGSSFAPGRMIVKLRNTSTAPVMQQTRTGVRVTASFGGANLNSLDSLNKKYKVNGIKQLFRTESDDKALVHQQGFVTAAAMTVQAGARITAIQEKYPKRSHRIEQMTEEPVNLPTNIYVVQMNEKTDVQAAVAEYKKDPNVVYAQPDFLVKVNMTPNDTLYPQLWGMQRIGANSAWDKSQGEGMVIAVVDTGVDYNHPDIRDNIWTNTREIPSNGIDDDGNGFIDDTRGWNFAMGTNNPMDGHGHGTHVAGTIAAVGNNGIGVIGVAPRAKIMPLKGMDDSGAGSMSNMANAIVYAASNGADIINNSWGCAEACPHNPVVEDAVRTAYGLGTLIVFAAGNSNMDVSQISPQNMQEVITVGAVGTSDRKSVFSNFGSKIDVVAPGEGIISLNAQGGNNAIAREIPSAIVQVDYLNIGGTSMAAPHVAGEAALLLALHPTWTIEQVKAVIGQSADDVASRGRDNQTGRGRINVATAVNEQTPRILKMNLQGNSLIFRKGDRVSVFATIDGADIVKYELMYAPMDGSANAIKIAEQPVSGPINNQRLVEWDTAGLMRDYYQLALRAYLSSGAVIEENLNLRFSSSVVVKIVDVSSRVSSSIHPYDHTVAIEGDNLIWTAGGNIFRHQFSNATTTQVSSDGLTSCGVAIENGKIYGWQACNYSVPGGISSRLLIYNLSDRSSRLMAFSAGHTILNVKENKIYNGSSIYNIDQDSYTQPPFHTTDLKSGSGDNVVFSGVPNGNWQVFLYNLRTQLSTPLIWAALFPKIASNNVIWVGYNSNQFYLVLRDLIGGTIKSLGKIRDYSAMAYEGYFKTDITSSKVVWVEDNEWGPTIWLYDIATESTTSIIPPEEVDQIKLSEDKIIWIGNSGVYAYYFQQQQVAIHVTKSGNGQGHLEFAPNIGIDCGDHEGGIISDQCSATINKGTKLMPYFRASDGSRFLRVEGLEGGTPSNALECRPAGEVPGVEPNRPGQVCYLTVNRDTNINVIFESVALADLTIADLTVTPEAPAIGQALNVSFKVKNIGQGNARAHVARIALFNAGGQNLGNLTVEIPELNAGAEHLVNMTFQHTANAVGVHSLVVMGDYGDGGVVDETNEENNNAESTVNFVDAKPDLTVETLAVDQAKARLNEQVPVKIVVKNIGQRITNVPVPMTVLLQKVGSRTVATQTILVNVLDTGASREFTAYVKPTTIGQWKIDVNIDQANVLEESDENNNTASNIVAVTKRSSDLAVKSLAGDNTVKEGEAIALSVVLENKGPDAPNKNVSLKVTVSGAATFSKSYTIASTESGAVSLPLDIVGIKATKEGKAIIKVEHDAGKVANDLDRTNNVITKEVTVTKRMSDLMVNLTTDKSSMKKGQFVGLSVDVTNIGADVPNVATKLKVTVSGAGSLSKIYTINADLSKDSVTVPIQLSVKATKVGKMTIKVEADYLKKAPDVNRDNNVQVSEVTVTN